MQTSIIETEQGNQLQAPAIHLNGTSTSELLAQYRAAVAGVNAAVDALCAARPHARDYYMTEGAYERARDEHEARLDLLVKVRNDMHTLALHAYAAQRANIDRYKARKAQEEDDRPIYDDQCEEEG